MSYERSKSSSELWMWLLVTNEPFEVQDFKKIPNCCRGIYRIYPNLTHYLLKDVNMYHVGLGNTNILTVYDQHFPEHGFWEPLGMNSYCFGDSNLDLSYIEYFEIVQCDDRLWCNFLLDMVVLLSCKVPGELHLLTLNTKELGNVFFLMKGLLSFRIKKR